MALIGNTARTAFIEYAANECRTVFLHLRLPQVQQLAVDAVGHTVDAVVLIVDIHFHETSLGAVASVVFSGIGQP